MFFSMYDVGMSSRKPEFTTFASSDIRVSVH
jgi:hypothetical protein